MEISSMIIRLGIVFLLAFAFGTQRQKSHKPVGFGTFIFVSMGACAMTLTGLKFYPDNPIFILGSILTGIGFLGAGALIRDNDKIFGFTTAASLWLFSILGIVFGMGEYFLGSIIYALVWVVILSDSHFERKGIGSYRKKLVIETLGSIEEKEVRKFLKEVGISKTNLISLEVNKETKKNIFSYFVEGNQNKIKEIPLQVSMHKWINSISLK